MRRRAARKPLRSSARTSWPSNRMRAGFRLDQTQDRAPGRRLSAAAFADERQRFAGVQRERHVLDGVHARLDAAEDAGVDVESRHEIGDFEHRALGRPQRSTPSPGTASRSPVTGSTIAKRCGSRPPLHRAQPRDRGKQRARVGLARRREELRGRRLLDRVAVEHHDDAIGDLGDHAHVVRDERDRHPLLVLQHLDQLEDLGLDRDVERGGRLVGDQQLRLARERHRDHHALAHAAGEPVRILVQSRRRGRNAHALENAQRLGLGLRAIEAAMVDERLGDLEAEREHRIQARHRLLEDHRDQVAAHLAHLLFGKLQQIAAFEQDLAGRAAVGGRQQPHDRERGDALARARFADDRHRLARRDLERNALHDGDPRLVDAERGRQVAHGEYRRR